MDSGRCLQQLLTLSKYSWQNGERSLCFGMTGEVVQFTTRVSRRGAWLGPFRIGFISRLCGKSRGSGAKLLFGCQARQPLWRSLD